MPDTPRTLVVQAVLAVVMSAAILAILASLTRLRTWDEAYFVVVVCAIVGCEVTAVAIARRLQLSFHATLGLVAADLVSKALHITAIARLPDVYVLGTMAIVFPVTPLLIAPLFRRWRVVEEPVGECTTGRLLRSKQARAASRAARAISDPRGAQHANESLASRDTGQP